MTFNLFDIAHDNRSLALERPRAACVDEVTAYMDWMRARLGLPDLGAADLQWRQPSDWRKGARYCVGATFGAIAPAGGYGRREYAPGAYSVLMPGYAQHRQRVTMESLGEAGDVVATSTLPAEPKRAASSGRANKCGRLPGPCRKPRRRSGAEPSP